MSVDPKIQDPGDTARITCPEGCKPAAREQSTVITEINKDHVRCRDIQFRELVLIDLRVPPPSFVSERERVASYRSTIESLPTALDGDIVRQALCSSSRISDHSTLQMKTLITDLVSPAK